MNKPIHCGKICQPTKKEYGKYGYYFKSESGMKWFAGSVMLHFRCRVCGYLGVPFIEKWDNSYMLSLNILREEGIKFDQTLLC